MVALLLLLGCTEPCPDGSMLDRHGGLLVTEDRHPTGWGQSECVACHAVPQLHRQGCTPEVDMALVRDIVADEGPSSCGSCHGANGVEEGR